MKPHVRTAAVALVHDLDRHIVGMYELERCAYCEIDLFRGAASGYDYASHCYVAASY
ncbi:hypothetical protein IVA95_29065 [Bradyrhizobium sp. 157]|nr:hypothetical protein [Bradyrhizobium sp. 157]